MSEEIKKTVVDNEPEPKDKEKTNEPKPEFTDEQQAYIDRIVSGIKNENKQKMADYEQKMGQAVEDKVNEQLAERERRAKMSAEEKAADDIKKLKEKNAQLSAQIEQRDRVSFGHSIAGKYNVPSSMVSHLIGKTNEETENNMKSFADEYNKAVQAGVDSRLAGTKQPQIGLQANIDSTKKLSELSLDEQTKLYKENPALYNQLASR